MLTILSNISYNKKYTNDIKKSKYSQKIQTVNVEQYKSLEELIIYTYDINSLLEKNDKLYIVNKKLQLAEDLSEPNSNYEKFNYSKILKKSEIQSGLQKSNTLTTILYLSDVYNVSITVYYNNKYYELFNKKRDIFYVEYSNTWCIVEKKILIPKDRLKN